MEFNYLVGSYSLRILRNLRVAFWRGDFCKRRGVAVLAPFSLCVTADLFDLLCCAVLSMDVIRRRFPEGSAFVGCND